MILNFAPALGIDSQHARSQAERDFAGATAFPELMYPGRAQTGCVKTRQAERNTRNHPSGVKTPNHYVWLIGTDESVPFQNSGFYGVLPQPVKPKALDGRFCGTTKVMPCYKAFASDTSTQNSV